MPWINVTCRKTLSEEHQDEAKAELAKILDDVLGKEESGLFITFNKAYGFYRAGQRNDDSAIFDVRYIGNFVLDKKREVTTRIANYFKELLGLDPEKVIVIFNEVSSENWGRHQGNYS